ncbi:MAG: SMP-30/gluconolactonase/LRE family protein [Thermoleophilia bacterium]|nr:SMP-30/gluconolactonase/LRE family protein [Thermoleophilia bacterium]
MAELVDPEAEFEILGTGFASTEGPVWVPDPGYLLFSEIRADRRQRWDEDGVREVAHPCAKGVGMTLDASGRLLVCEHVTNSIVRMDAAGTGAGREVLASHYGELELNSPNDVVVRADGSIWFTDPPGGRTAAMGVERSPELDFQGVFRLRDDGALDLIADDFELPNGLCFSPDESRLYVNDTYRAQIRVFELGADGSVTGQGIFAEGIALGPGAVGWLDGMKCDEQGNVWVTGPRGLWVFDGEGGHLGIVRTPQPVLNFHWGGADWSTLYMAGETAVFRLPTRTAGRREPFMR